MPAIADDERHEVSADPVEAKPFSLADFPDDEDKTAAFEVPEELLRRSRVGKEPIPSRLTTKNALVNEPVGFTDDDEAPDSRANTSPPPAPGAVVDAPLAAGRATVDVGLGRVFEQAAASETSGRKLALVGDYANDLIDDEESGEFTRIGRDDELQELSMQLKEAKVPNVIVADEQTSLEATRTKVRAKQNVQQTAPSNGLLWGIIVVLLLATSVLAALLLKAV